MTKAKSAPGLQFDPDMPEDAVAILRSHGVRRTFSKNQMVVAIGDDFPELFIVDGGRFSISVIDETGSSWIYGYLAVGSTWGLKAVLTDKPADFIFESLEDSVATCVERKTLWSLIDTDPIVRRGVILSLGWSISKATMFAHKERTLPLRVRLVHFLVEHADENGTLELTQSVMARILGVSRYALGSELQKLKRQALIEINYGRIKVIDINQLHKTIGSP